MRKSQEIIVELSEANVVHATRVERARRELIMAQIEALHDAERSGNISSAVSITALAGLNKALGESEFIQEEIQDASRTEEETDTIVEGEVSEVLIPESTESIVGQSQEKSEEE